MLQKPISPLNATRCFGAGLGLMMRERRRYFRFPMEMPTMVVIGQDHEQKVIATNLSEGGMAIRFRGKMPRGRISKVVFTLPGSDASMEPKAEIAWVDGAGRAGIRFVDLPRTSRQLLEKWLDEKMKSLDPFRGAAQPVGV